MSRPVLGIDQGTSGTTALVVDPDRGVLGAATVAVRPRYGPAGTVEVDPQELFGSVVEAGRRALTEAGEPVAAVGLANQGETVLAWDPVSGIPFTDAVVWQDRRAQEICDELTDAADGLRQLTGLPLDPYFAAPKMAWLRRHRTRAGVVTTSDAWLVHQLTGAFVTDAATASRTMLLDLDAVDWSGEALEAFDLAGEPLPEIVDADQPVGTTDVFGPALPVTGLLVDQQAALLAQHCLEPGAAKCTYGTGAFVLANAGSAPVRSKGGLVACVAWRLRGATSYCLDGQVYTVGSAVRWLADLGVVSGPEDLDRLGGEAPDAGGVTFVPAFAGLAAPTWRGDARAQIGGLGLGVTRAHVVRALVDGIAAQVVELTEAMSADLGVPIRALRVDGGLSRSRVLLQIQADLLQRPVEVYPSPEATALGAAAVARMGLEPGTTIPEATGAWQPAAVYEPRISADEAEHRLGTHRDVVRRLLGETGGFA